MKEYLGAEKPINKIQPVVSVCLVTYNHAQYINQCIDNILNQKTNFPFELIIGEDDSTDGTREICIEYAQKNPDKIRLFLREEKDKIWIDGTKTGRFNFIENLKIAKGTYIALCDGDDYWTDYNKLEYQKEYMDKNKEISICGALANSSINEFAYLIGNPAGQIEVFSFEEVFQKRHIGHSSSWFFRNEINEFVEDSYFNFKYPVGDTPLLYYLMTKGSFALLNKNLTYYRIKNEGIYNSLDEEKKLLKGLKLMKQLSERFNVEKSLKQEKINYLKYALLNHYRKEQKWYRYSKEWIKFNLNKWQSGTNNIF